MAQALAPAQRRERGAAERLRMGRHYFLSLLPMKRADLSSFNPKSLEPHAALREALCHRLSALPYPAYVRLVRELLLASGYASVRLMKSTSASGFPAAHAPAPGGFDLVAAAHTDLSTHLTAIQIKRSQDPVGRRYVDELRGAMLRLGAEQGLLVTTGTFSIAAQGAAQTLGILPVRLLDGEELSSRLLERGQGVRIRSLPRHPGDVVHWELDEAFLGGLSQEASPSQASPSQASPSQASSPLDNPKR